MASVNDKMFKMTSESLLMPKTNNTRSTEGNSRSGEGKMKFNPTMREMPSESVGKDSMPGWVKRNVNDFEPMEGRL